MIWFTSDNHFFHKNIIRLSHRPFQHLHAMHEDMIKKWNDRVQPTEIVYIVGDFSFANPTLTKKIMDRLNGYKILIKGNHDPAAHRCLQAGFNEVHENIFVDLVAQGGKSHRVFLSHFPYRHNFWKWLKWKVFGGYWDTRYNYKRMVDDGHWLIHGHTHQRYKLKNKMIHVGVDAWDYRPVSHHEIIKLIEENSGETLMSRLINCLFRLGILRGREVAGARNNNARGKHKGQVKTKIPRSGLPQASKPLGATLQAHIEAKAGQNSD